MSASWKYQTNSSTMFSKAFKDASTDPVFRKCLLIALVLFLVTSIILQIQKRLSRLSKFVNGFPGPASFPIFGNIELLLVSPEGMAEKIAELAQKYGRCFRFWIFQTPYVAIAEAGAAEKVLSTSLHVHKGRDYDRMKWFVGNGLLTSNGESWRKDRKLLNPTFKYQNFDGFLSSFNKHAQILKDVLDQKFPTGSSKELNLRPTFCMCTMDTISESALGKISSFQHDPNVRFLEELQTALTALRVRVTKPWLTLPLIWDIFGMGRKEANCIKFFKTALGQIIESRRGRGFPDDQVTKPFIDTMLDCRSEEDIVSHIITTFVAGLDTTASGINHTLYLLGRNPEIQVKVHAELDQVFGNDMERDVTFTDLAELKYLEMCIKEALRILPPVPLVIKSLQSDVELDKGMTIPRGTEVVVFIYELHRDPNVFPDPETFDPDRFLPQACAARSPYAYQPFSIGPRNCIGQKYAMLEMKVILIHILRRFRVSSSKGLEEVGVIMGIITELKNHLPLLLTKRC